MKKTTIFFLRFFSYLFLIGLASCDSDNPTEFITPTENEAPNQFDLITLANNSINTETLPSFTWETAIDPEEDMVTYTFILDTIENPNSVLIDDLTTTSYSLTEELELDTVYYWKVIAQDSNGNATESGVFNFKTRALSLINNNIVENAPFTARSNHSSVVFDNKIWIIGGSISNDVWSSSDGTNWVLETANAGFSPRESQTSLVFDNKIWVIGGFGLGDTGSTEGLNDVWSSSDGVNWTLETADANFEPRFLHSSVVFDNKMWVINGFDPLSSSPILNDVWSSSDGIEWELVTDNPALDSSIVNESLVFDNKIWVLGGNTTDGMTNTVYSSSNGIDWEVATENAFFTPRNISAATVLNNRMWIFGGETADGITNDIWYSSDGISWCEATSTPTTYTPRLGHTASLLNNVVYIIAGNFNGTNLNDVWELEVQ